MDFFVFLGFVGCFQLFFVVARCGFPIAWTSLFFMAVSDSRKSECQEQLRGLLCFSCLCQLFSNFLRCAQLRIPPCVDLFVFHGICSPLDDLLTAADKRHMSKTHCKGKLGIALLDITWTFELVTVFVLL